MQEFQFQREKNSINCFLGSIIKFKCNVMGYFMNYHFDSLFYGKLHRNVMFYCRTSVVGLRHEADGTNAIPHDLYTLGSNCDVSAHLCLR